MRRGGLRSADRPADGLALGVVVPLSSFATRVLWDQAVWGRSFGALSGWASVIKTRVKGKHDGKEEKEEKG